MPDGSEVQGTTPANESEQDSGKKPSFLDTLKPEDQNYIHSLREEAKAKRIESSTFKKELDELKASLKKQEDDKLAAQGEYKKLLDERTSELEKVKAELSEYKEVAKSIEGELEKRVKALPASIQALKPSDMKLSQLLDWIAKAEAVQSDKRTALSASANGGQSPKPQPNGLDDKVIDDTYKEYANSGRYSM